MSKTKIRSAQYSINEYLKQLKGYSFASRADMRHMLNRCIKDLHELGFNLTHIKGLKPKHIHVLVEHWKTQNKNPATIKNYMAKLRKMAILLDKPQLVKPSNDTYQISRRSYVPTHNKAIHQVDFSKCTDPMIRLSLEAQSLFGLRREESMKLIISEAWIGDSLRIKPSWTKGGIGRTLHITNDNQRQWLLKTSHSVPSRQSLIPQDRTYKQHLSHYQMQTKQMGIRKCHGLRHAYAQNRYHELTKELDPHKKGWLCPIANSLASKPPNALQKAIDRKTREIISRELGHARRSITKIYCGK
ncbi:MAG: phage integrase N-terminal domain-containing protein [Gammaproteobacteria bacterium]